LFPPADFELGALPNDPNVRLSGLADTMAAAGRDARRSPNSMMWRSLRADGRAVLSLWETSRRAPAENLGATGLSAAPSFGIIRDLIRQVHVRAGA
jgi:hypothetical protein